MDVHFNAYKVKYQQLNYFLRPIRNSQMIASINIFVNLDDLFHSLHRPIINNEFQVCGIDASKQLISNCFNVLGHYRNWALKEGLRVKVFGIYTSNLRSFKNNIYIHDYRKRFRELNDEASGEYYFINQAIYNALPQLGIIANYIPDVYMIDSKYLEPSMLPLYLFENRFRSNWNVLISRDSYDLQYAYRNKWSVISPKGDNSYFVNEKNMWDYLNIRERIYKDPIELQYDYSLYTISKAIVGDKYRNIPRLRKIGWKTLFKYLDDIKEQDHSSSVLSKKNLLILLKDKKISNDDINNNIYCIDIDMQDNALMDIDKTSISIQLQDIPDDRNLQIMNNQIFAKYPINLQFLRNQSAYKSPFD